ncbi:hypothetical protein [Sporosarcina sp. FA9]|uniref:hypothetical protein n=1 Tax=Sporosarcina sp. FA9 TaxID=3413030 RepID=UPI003F659EA4
MQEIQGVQRKVASVQRNLLGVQPIPRDVQRNPVSLQRRMGKDNYPNAFDQLGEAINTLYGTCATKRRKCATVTPIPEVTHNPS